MSMLGSSKGLIQVGPAGTPNDGQTKKYHLKQFEDLRDELALKQN